MPRAKEFRALRQHNPHLAALSVNIINIDMLIWLYNYLRMNNYLWNYQY